MAFWLYITNLENWKITKQTDILGASAKHKTVLSRVKESDKCLIYVKREVIAGETIDSNIVAEYEIASTIFEDSKKMFVTPQDQLHETYPLRLRLELVRVFEPPIKFKPLIQSLSFLPNKTKWTGPIRGKAMVQIPESDYDRVVSGAEKKTKQRRK
jgi:predicted RNA-binding protein